MNAILLFIKGGAALKITDEAIFHKHLKENQLSPVYLLCGKENYLKKRYLSRMIDQIVDDRSGFNYQEFAGKELDMEKLCDAVVSLPVFAAKKCVVVKDLDIEKQSAAERNKLEELLSDLPKSTVLLFCYLDLEVDFKKKCKV